MRSAVHLAARLAVLLAFALALPSIAEARWLEARSPNFVVYSDGGEADLRQSVQRLEDFDGLLRTLTGTTALPSASPLRIYRVGSPEALAALGNSRPGVLGFYTARVGMTAAFAVRGDQPGLDGEQVLLHEYAHHFAMRYYPAYYPTWYGEGFAEYVMTADFRSDRIEIGRVSPGRAASLVQGSWMPLDRILGAGIAGLNREQTAQYYAQSWLIVHYLFAAPERREALTRYLADLHRGIAEPSAFRAAFGQDHAGFEKALKAYRDGRIGYGAIGRAATPDVAIAVRVLPPSADDLLLLNAALTLGIPDPAREAATVATIRKIAAHYPDDRFALHVLARAEVAGGDRAVGRAIVERLIEASPRDAELLYIRGTVDYFPSRKDAANRDALLAAARPWFARAVEADPTYYAALYRLAQTTPADGTISDETLARLVTAHQLAPLVGDIAIDAATALHARGRDDEAAAALIPIATNPHGGNVDRARALLDRIRAGI